MAIIYTGKYLDKDVATELGRRFRTAQSIPQGMVISDRHKGPNGIPDAVKALERVKDDIDRACVEAGLPEPEKDEDGDVIHYGVDFGSREILSWKPLKGK